MRPIDDDTIEFLRHRVRELEALLGQCDLFLSLSELTPTERAVLGILYTRRIISTSGIHTVLYGAMPAESQPEGRVVEQWICRLRKKLADRGVEIVNQHGSGYYLPPESKRALQRFSDKQGVAA